MTRMQELKTSEMREVAVKVQLMAQRMLEAIDKMESRDKTTLEIDGWPSALRGAKLVRNQFVKLIGEANLMDVQFEDSTVDAEKKAKPSPAEVSREITKRRISKGVEPEK
jgi:hypothetical protein